MPFAVRPRHVVQLLSLCVAMLVSIELVARYVLPRVSKIERRTAIEKQAAQSLGGSARTPDHLLLLGNSLLEASILVDDLDKSLAPDWRASRFVVESTGYADWYFGLKNLLENGARPSVVALMLSPRQFVSNGIRGSYSAYHLFSTSDTLRAGARLGYGRTQSSDLLFSNLSAAYGVRYEIRNFFLKLAVPGVDKAVEVLKGTPQQASIQLPETAAATVGDQRLDELADLCKTHSVKCVFVFPPALGQVDAGTLELLRRADARGFESSRLRIDSSLLDSRDFQADRYHMGKEGAAKYTGLLLPRLRDVLSGVQ